MLIQLPRLVSKLFCAPGAVVRWHVLPAATSLIQLYPVISSYIQSYPVTSSYIQLYPSYSVPQELRWGGTCSLQPPGQIEGVSFGAFLFSTIYQFSCIWRNNGIGAGQRSNWLFYTSADAITNGTRHWGLPQWGGT